MPLFALPVLQTTIPPPPRIHFTPTTTNRKRKRGGTSPTPSVLSSDNEDDKPSPYDDEDDVSLPAASTNPLSLRPSEILQYRLAGLELDEELPSKSVRDFPHRALPEHIAPPAPAPKPRVRKSERNRGGGIVVNFADKDKDEVIPPVPEKNQRDRGPRLRLQHLGVLTTVVHKCLQDGDIPRAMRAYAMLIRAETGGKGMDIRSSGYWGIGAELLMRSQDRDLKGKGRDGGERNWASNSEEDEEEDGERGAERRWGSAVGLERAKEYFERLILQHPYMRQYHGSVTALDFWPAMLGCELYGIQFEHKDALRRIDLEEKDEGDYGHQPDNYEDYKDEDDDSRDRRQRFETKEARWKEREEARQTALGATEKLVAKMDELMTSLPYSDSHVLLRLRGMLALYIGDLSIPAPPDAEEEQYLEEESRLGNQNIEHRNRKFIIRQRRTDHEQGRKRQEEARPKARNIFERVEKEGGRVGVDLRDLSPEPEDNEYEDENYIQDELGRVVTDLRTPSPEPQVYGYQDEDEDAEHGYYESDT